MSLHFPPGDRELADWSDVHMIDNLSGLPRRLPGGTRSIGSNSSSERSVVDERLSGDIYLFLDRWVQAFPFAPSLYILLQTNHLNVQPMTLLTYMYSIITHS